jgi:Cd2+/Zn2+-exporting ATPase
VAEAAGLKQFKANLLPDQKQALVREYQRRYGKVGMVGDGINDAPALAAADVGIVMGAIGSDTAMETADIALMGDELTLLPYLIRLSRRTLSIIRQNILFSLGTKAILLVTATFVGLPLWLAVLGDVGVSLLVTLNAMRLMDGRQAAVLLPAAVPTP